MNMSSSEELIADRLRELKKSRGLTNQQIADAVNVSQPTVSRWLRGDFLPPREALESLARFFNVSLAYVSGIVAAPSKKEELAGIEEALSAAIDARERLDYAISALKRLRPKESVVHMDKYKALGGCSIAAESGLSGKGPYLRKRAEEKQDETDQIHPVNPSDMEGN